MNLKEADNAWFLQQQKNDLKEIADKDGIFQRTSKFDVWMLSV